MEAISSSERPSAPKITPYDGRRGQTVEIIFVATAIANNFLSNLIESGKKVIIKNFFVTLK